MPIKSYLVHPKEGRKEDLLSSLKTFTECEVLPSQSHDVIVLVTETEDKGQEEILLEKINALEGLNMLSMVSGFNVTPKE